MHVLCGDNLQVKEAIIKGVVAKSCATKPPSARTSPTDEVEKPQPNPKSECMLKQKQEAYRSFVYLRDSDNWKTPRFNYHKVVYG